MSNRAVWQLGATAVLALGAVGAACGPRPTQGVTPTPTASPVESVSGGKACKAVSNPLEPSLVAWNAGDRAQITALRAQGVVAVRYTVQGCNVELEVLTGCIGRGATYTFTASPSQKQELISNERQLFAELPLGAASLSGRLRGKKALRTDYALVGVASLPADKVFTRAELSGPDCARATHVVARVHLGGFAMATGAEEELAASASFFGVGAGGEQTRRGAMMFSDGEPAPVPPGPCLRRPRESAPGQACRGHPGRTSACRPLFRAACHVHLSWTPCSPWICS